MYSTLNMMIILNIINRIDMLIDRLNNRRKYTNNYHPNLIIRLRLMLIDVHDQRRCLE